MKKETQKNKIKRKLYLSCVLNAIGAVFLFNLINMSMAITIWGNVGQHMIMTEIGFYAYCALVGLLTIVGNIFLIYVALFKN